VSGLWRRHNSRLANLDVAAHPSLTGEPEAGTQYLPALPFHETIGFEPAHRRKVIGAADYVTGAGRALSFAAARRGPVIPTRIRAAHDCFVVGDFDAVPRWLHGDEWHYFTRTRSITPSPINRPSPAAALTLQRVRLARGTSRSAVRITVSPVFEAGAMTDFGNGALPRTDFCICSAFRLGKADAMFHQADHRGRGQHGSIGRQVHRRQ